MDSNSLFLSHFFLYLDNYSLNGELKGNPFGLFTSRCCGTAADSQICRRSGENLFSSLL